MTSNQPLTNQDAGSNKWLLQGLVLFWILMLILGAVTVGMPSSLQSSQQVSFNRSFFTAANVSTLTGFPATFAQPEDFQKVVQIVFLLQTLSGLLLSLIGGGLLLNRVLNHRHSELRIVTCGLVMIILGGLIGIATNDPSSSILSGLLRGAFALGGSALQVGSRLPSDSGLLHIVFIPLSLMGGIGTYIVCDLYDLFYKQRPLSIHTLTGLSVIAVLYLAVCLILIMMFNSVPRAGALAGSALGFGYTDELISQLPRSVYWILLASMLTCSCSAGTGGLGIGWLWTLPQEVLRMTSTGLVLLFSFVFLGMISLAHASTQLNTEQALMLTIGSLTNVGMPFSTINLSNTGLSLLGLLMIIGKVLPLIVMNEIIATRDTIDRQTAA